MSDIETRAHLLTVEYLRIAIENGVLKPPLLPEVYAHAYKQNYQRILAELKKP